MLKLKRFLHLKERERRFEGLRDMSFMTYYEYKVVTIIVKRYGEEASKDMYV